MAAARSEMTERQRVLATLAQDLVATGYVDLFHRGDERLIDRYWNAPAGPANLKELAENPASLPHAAFLAAEILFHKGGYAPSGDGAGALATAYAAALAHQYIKFANPWGLPGELDGAAGRHLVALGAVVVPKLDKLLDDETPMLYVGSKEAMLGNSYHYRVKDAAAFFIATILRRPFTVDEKPVVRDQAIRSLKAAGLNREYKP